VAGDGGGTPVDPQERRLQLIRSTYRVMSRGGSRRLSLQAVADEAGVSKGLVLYHFKSKDNLLLATMRYVLERTEARIRAAVRRVAGPQDLIPALVDAVFTTAAANRDFTLLYIELVERAAREPSFGEVAVLSSRIVNGLYEEIVREGQVSGVFEVSDAVLAAATMRALIEGTLLGWLPQQRWEERHGEYKAICHDGLVRLLGVRATEVALPG
jgi:AcrR family transcriptional regulator